MSSISTPAVSWSLAVRSILLIPRVPSTFIPSLVMPLFLTIAFAGAFSGLVLLPGFPADKAVDWFIPMTMIQGSAFAGVTTGMGVARDIESGFYDRLLASPAPRVSLMMGPLIASVLRALVPFTMLTVVAILAGANFKAGIVGVLMLAVAGMGIALVAGAWSLVLAFKFKTQQVAPLMQVGIFLTVFLSTAQMPLELLSGWLHTVARFNPMTRILALARQGFLGEVTWATTWPGLVAIAGLSLFLMALAYRALMRMTP